MDRMPSFPRFITLNEVGPRDGFQFEPKIVPTTLKLDIIHSLVAAGLRHIQVTSFVNPVKVPQMADAEDVCAGLDRVPGVEYSALVLNLRGLERAQKAGITHVEVSLSVSNTHSLKNTAMTTDQSKKMVKQMVRLAKDAGMIVRGGIQCAFGCVYEGNIDPEVLMDFIGMYLELDVDRICLADTTGMANPLAIRQLLDRLVPVLAMDRLTLHLHDTRGLGLANMVTAMEFGVANFDASAGGMGGCPFVQGAAGNIATEDVVNMLTSMDIATGVAIEAIVGVTRRLEQFFEKSFPAKMGRVLRIAEQHPCEA